MNKNKKSLEDAAIKLAANSYVEKEGQKIIEEAKIINQSEKITEEELSEFENLCNKEFKKKDRKERFYSISKVAVAVIAIFIFVSGVYQYNLTKSVSSNQNDRITVVSSENYIGDDKLLFVPEYVPQSFKKEEVYFFDNQNVIIDYRFNIDEGFAFSYELINDSNQQEYENIEDYKLVDINGVDAKVTHSQDETTVKVIWKKGEHIFCIDAQGVKQKQVIKIARSVTNVKEK